MHSDAASDGEDAIDDEECRSTATRRTVAFADASDLMDDDNNELRSLLHLCPPLPPHPSLTMLFFAP